MTLTDYDEYDYRSAKRLKRGGDMESWKYLPLSVRPANSIYIRHLCGELIAVGTEKYGGAHIVRCSRCNLIVDISLPRCPCCRKAFGTQDDVSVHMLFGCPGPQPIAPVRSAKRIISDAQRHAISVAMIAYHRKRREKEKAAYSIPCLGFRDAEHISNTTRPACSAFDDDNHIISEAKP